MGLNFAVNVDFWVCNDNFNKNKTLWERILGRRCIRHIGMYVSWEFACTSVQGLMWGVLSIGIVLYVVDWWLTFVTWNM